MRTQAVKVEWLKSIQEAATKVIWPLLTKFFGVHSFYYGSYYITPDQLIMGEYQNYHVKTPLLIK